MTKLTKISREYVDLDFSFNKNPITDNVSIKKQNNSVKQSIIHLLTLKEGEKPFHPEIKSPIYGFLFENSSMVTQVVLEGEVLKYLKTFEPRVIFESVSVSFPNPNAINCTVTGNIINVAEPFTVDVLINRLR